LLQRKPSNRLGANGINELKDHPWFKNYPWDDMYQKKCLSPYIPKFGDNFDKKYCEGADKIGNETYERYQCYYKNEEFVNVFNEYTFANIDIKECESILTKSPTKNFNGNSSTSRSEVNLLGKTKRKITESLTPIKPMTKPRLHHANSISSPIGTPDKVQKFRPKNNSISSTSFNSYSSQAKASQYARYQSNMNNTNFKFNNDKGTDRLPFIESKLTKNNTIKSKLANSGNSNKLLNSTPTGTGVLKNFTKFSTISANSTGASSGSNKIAHKRSGSSNYIEN
jgi:hypothetical protein